MELLVGYMRVSSDSDRQTTHLQRDALFAAGVDERHLFEDKASGARSDRSQGNRNFNDASSGFSPSPMIGSSSRTGEVARSQLDHCG